LLTLWSMARSPLIMGGELLTTPQWVISLLQNKEVLAVDQGSSENRQVYRNDSDAVWIARDSMPGTRYVALFNLGTKSRTVHFNFTPVPDLQGQYKVRDLWRQNDVGVAQDHLSATIGPHGAILFKLTAVR
jgi:alpha-galactosidase